MPAPHDIYRDYELPPTAGSTGLTRAIHVSYCRFDIHDLDRPCWRDMDMMLITLSGRCQFHHTYQTEPTRGERSSVTLYRRGEHQRYHSQHRFEVVAFLMHLGSGIKQTLKAMGHPRGHTWTDALDESLLRETQGVMRYEHLPPAVAAHRNALLIERCLLQALKVQTPASTEPALPNRTRLNDISAYIHLNPERPHNVQDLADMAGLSASRFRALFAQEFGQSVGKFVQQVRMQQARWLLIHDDQLTAAEVGHRLGYANPYAFYTAFKQATGQTPSGFRAGLVRS